MTKHINKHLGSSFESFLGEEGLTDEVNVLALKRSIASEMRHQMETQGVTRAQLAKRLGTSVTQIGRLLDPANANQSLETLNKAAEALGLRMRVVLERSSPGGDGTPARAMSETIGRVVAAAAGRPLKEAERSLVQKLATQFVDSLLAELGPRALGKARRAGGRGVASRRPLAPGKPSKKRPNAKHVAA